MQQEITQPKGINLENDRSAVVLAVMYAILFIASLVVFPILAPSARIPNPFGPEEQSKRFFLENSSAIRVSDWLQLASAICLAGLGCVWHRSPAVSGGVNRTASNYIAVGSLGAAIVLTLAALTSWSLASPGAVDPGTAFRALQFLPFLLGGPGWAAFFALFMLGVSRTCVDHAPRWFTWSGYGLSVASAVATLVLITLAVAPFLPLARFLGFVWLIAAAVILSRAAKRGLSASRAFRG